jgi:radical SAM superfamily enzyme YgiQ (UPF0313 family)
MTARIYIDPVKKFGADLLSVEKPARYTGGEYGRLARRDAAFQMLIAFPDLYEIGMSNQALRILYNGLNRLHNSPGGEAPASFAGVAAPPPDISCDRAFAPAPDFEKLLKEKKTPLYGLDTGISLGSLDVLMFTLGYELGAGGVLCMLDVSGIPLHREQRTEKDPVVIAGGPCVSNPLPYASFIDAFWIGEAEAGFFELAAELAALKKAGEGRGGLLKKIASHPNMWLKGKAAARRAIDANFSRREGEAAVFPVPGMKIVQHHGALEIMSGCPNGCRFCHAGFWYRPMRQKSIGAVLAEAGAFIDKGGYREISLSSLSSGDYRGITELADSLNRRFSGRHVSFQLPSLKVSSFSLSLLEKISKTRKSGLTFAVETPVEAWQLSINKKVSLDSVIQILKEAKKNGWRGAKFYFMLGLPPGNVSGDTGDSSAGVGARGSEEAEIVDFILAAARGTGMHFNINVGVFVPKPHTPYQRTAQIDTVTAQKKLEYLRTKLKPLGHKLSFPDTLVSLIEGLLSRGDERAGNLLEEAYTRGSRLDAWSEFINKEIWREILEKYDTLIQEFTGKRDVSGELPWASINSCVLPGFLEKQAEASDKEEFTLPCIEKCANPCGVCGKDLGIVRKNIQSDENSHIDIFGDSAVPEEEKSDEKPQKKQDPSVRRIIFSFSKEGGAVFYSHLSLVEIFSMAFIRAGLMVMYTGGFNPLPKLEIVSPLSLGICAEAEIASVDFPDPVVPMEFKKSLNRNLPEGLSIKGAEAYFIPRGCKKHSLSSLLWGFSYAGEKGEAEFVRAADEKSFREKQIQNGVPRLSLRRLSVLAKNIAAGQETGGPENSTEIPPCISYFKAYHYLYPASAIDSQDLFTGN